jgi:hypothetical protein
LTCILAGDEEVARSIIPTVESFGRKIIFVGPVPLCYSFFAGVHLEPIQSGTAHAVKSVNNAIGATQVRAFGHTELVLPITAHT